MKSIVMTAVVLAVGLTSAGAQNLEALKGASFEASFQFARQTPMPPPPAAVPVRVVHPGYGAPLQTRVYQKGGYTWESDAQSARAQAENNLRLAGLSVISAQVFKESNFPFNYGMRIEFLAKAYQPVLQTYTGGAFTWESDASAELQRTVANLKATGVKIVLGQVKKQANYPFNYFYEVDYLQHGAPPVHQPVHHEQTFVSPQTYPAASAAKWALDREVHVLQQKGCHVLSSKVFHDYMGYKFSITYMKY